MPIRFSCSACAATLKVKDELAGKLAACPKCKAKVRLPQVSAAASMLRTEAMSTGGRFKWYLLGSAAVAGVGAVVLLVAVVSGMLSSTGPTPALRAGADKPSDVPDEPPPPALNVPAAHASVVDTRFLDSVRLWAQKEPTPTVSFRPRAGHRFLRLQFRVAPPAGQPVKLDLHQLALEGEGKSYPIAAWGTGDGDSPLQYVLRWDDIDQPRPELSDASALLLDSPKEYKFDFRRDHATASLVFHEVRSPDASLGLVFVVPEYCGDLTARGFSTLATITGPKRPDPPAVAKLTEPWQSDYEAFVADFVANGAFAVKPFHQQPVRWPLFFRQVREAPGGAELEFEATEYRTTYGIGVTTRFQARADALPQWKKVPPGSLVVAAGRLHIPARESVPTNEPGLRLSKAAVHAVEPAEVRPVYHDWQTDFEKFLHLYQRLILAGSADVSKTFDGQPVRWVIPFESIIDGMKPSPVIIENSRRLIIGSPDAKDRDVIWLEAKTTAIPSWKALSKGKAVEMLGRLHVPPGWSAVTDDETGLKYPPSAYVKQVLPLGEVDRARLPKRIMIAADKKDPTPDKPAEPAAKEADWQKDFEKFVPLYQKLAFQSEALARRTFDQKPVRWSLAYKGVKREANSTSVEFEGLVRDLGGTGGFKGPVAHFKAVPTSVARWQATQPGTRVTFTGTVDLTYFSIISGGGGQKAPGGANINDVAPAGD